MHLTIDAKIKTIESSSLLKTYSLEHQLVLGQLLLSVTRYTPFRNTVIKMVEKVHKITL